MVAVDEDITSRLTKSWMFFGKLQDHLWKVHSISLSTKIVVYRAIVLTSLLYGSETWTLYRHQIRKLDQFHMCCLCSTARIEWQDRVPNTSVLEICGLTGIEAYAPSGAIPMGRSRCTYARY